MKKIFAILILLMTLLTACQPVNINIETVVEAPDEVEVERIVESDPDYLDPDLSPAERAEDLLVRMTLAEKIAGGGAVGAGGPAGPSEEPAGHGSAPGGSTGAIEPP